MNTKNITFDKSCKSGGFTLVEIMVVMVILSLLAFFAAPEIQNWAPARRLSGASQQLYADMQNAKISAVKDNSSSVLTFSSAAPCTAGSYTFDNGVSTAVTVCVSDEYPDVVIANAIAGADGFTSRGLAIGAGGVMTLTSTKLPGSGDPFYTVTLTTAGGVQFDKDKNP